MNFNAFDLLVCIGFYAAVLGFAFWKSRGSAGATDYFLGGRSLPWWLIGVSIVAANISTEQMVGMAGPDDGGRADYVSMLADYRGDWRGSASVARASVSYEARGREPPPAGPAADVSAQHPPP